MKLFKTILTILAGFSLLGVMTIPGFSEIEEKYSVSKDYPEYQSNKPNSREKNQSIKNLALKPGKNVVTYNSDGDKIVAHLFIPEDYKSGDKRPAIVINPPATGVKEQTIGIYAKELSKKGFITLAFDPRGFGESEGHPKLLNPYRMAEDIRNSVSFLRTLNEVDENNVFSMGICAGAGFAAYATAFESRIKALVIVSPFLTTSEEFFELAGGSANLRATLLPIAAAAEQKYFETGEDTMIEPVPVTKEAIATARPIPLGMRNYYLPGQPGNVPTWSNELSAMSLEPMLGFSIYNYTQMFDAIPVYMVYGDNAASTAGAIRFYDALNGTKEKLVLKNASHFDLYWKPNHVEPSVEGIAAFLKSYVE